MAMQPNDGEEEAAQQPSLPFEDEELAVAVKNSVYAYFSQAKSIQRRIQGRINMPPQVLETVGKDQQWLQHKKLKALRKALFPLLSWAKGRYFHGKDPEEHRQEKRRKKDDYIRRQQKLAHDRNLINNKRLRSERIKQLNRLISSGHQPNNPALCAVPDGAVEDEMPMSRQLSIEEAPSESSTSESHQQDADSQGHSELQHLLRSCYICKTRFTKLHHFYDALCPACAELNFAKRHATANLRGRVAIVTGGRIKIGFQIGVKLLRAGATVIVTSRFPNDAAERYQTLPDWLALKDRVHFYGLDLRNLPSVEAFCDWALKSFDRLDIIINNACQTVRRPVTYYRDLVEKELAISQPPKQVVHCLESGTANQLSDTQESSSSMHCTMAEEAAHRPDSHNAMATASAPASGPVVGVTAASALQSAIPMTVEDHDFHSQAFPEGMKDVNGMQLDLRSKNSWVLKLHEVSTPELAEVFAINTLSPFVLNGRLRQRMQETAPKQDKYIVNVSAMEGKFYRFKTPNHPHTNMAKAALNMMTRTSAQDYAKDRILMNSVDTGWINDENPLPKAQRIASQHDFQTPIDEVDAAARVLDPVFRGINEGWREHGMFLKDYTQTEW